MIKLAVVERYSESDSLMWEDVGLNERDVLPALLRLARAAKARLESGTPETVLDVSEALDAFDFGDA